MRPDELATRAAIQVPDDGPYETLGGLVMTELGRIPAVGDVVDLPAEWRILPETLGPLTYMWLHADWMHLLGNMLFLVVLGLLLEAKKQYLRGHIVTRQDGSVKAVWQRMKEWFLGNF